MKHEGVRLDGYNCDEKYEFEINSQPAAVNALRAVLRCFAVRRLTIPPMVFKSITGHFCPRKAGV